jgi:UDP-N-acetylmuramate--alanine ligase
MIRLDDIQKVYFIGIGGIGMSALARYFNQKGLEVAGYDKTPSPLTGQLQAEGMQVSFEDDPDTIPFKPDLVVLTPAIPKDNLILRHCQSSDWEILKRSEVLGLLSKGHFAIAVGGSHGKTTVSSMIAHLLACGGVDCTAFLGGISLNLDSNFRSGTDNSMVMEADEYDRSFLRLYPNIAVVTAVDSDHLDVYGSMQAVEEAFVQFASQITGEGLLIHKHGIGSFKDLEVDIQTYHLSESNADLFVKSYAVSDGRYQFETNDGKLWELPMGGRHNMENALAAILVSRAMRVKDEKIAACLTGFKGIYRRFEKIFSSEKKVFVDDYAHHPEEIRAFLLSLREMYPGEEVAVAFQPHLFSRTRDLADGFAESLSQADEVFLLPIYPAREQPMEGVSSKMIADLIHGVPVHLTSKEELSKKLTACSAKVIATVGAGDIDRLVQPIAQTLKTMDHD